MYFYRPLWPLRDWLKIRVQPGLSKKSKYAAFSANQEQNQTDRELGS